MLYNVLGDNLIYDPITKKLDAKENDFISFFKGKMLIQDHSITYLNLQDKSGMKFNSSNKVTEIINNRNKLFEYKYDQYRLNYNINYIVDNINPNESHSQIQNNSYLESNIIEDYRVTIFIVIKENNDTIFKLYDKSDHLLTLLDVDCSRHSSNKIIIVFTTTNMYKNTTIVTNMLCNKKNIIFISWNGVNSAAYLNGKKEYTFTHSGVSSTTSGTHRFVTPDDGKLYEFIIFNSLLLNDEKINSINKYLANKHNITLSV